MSLKKLNNNFLCDAQQREVEAAVDVSVCRSPRVRVQRFFDPSRNRTKQCFKDECDVNNIMRRYSKKQFRDAPIAFTYGDCADLVTAPRYQEAMDFILQAQDSFSALPSDVRARFSNDPANFLEFMHNPNNEDEARKLGLLKPKAVNPVVPVSTPDEKKEV